MSHCYPQREFSQNEDFHTILVSLLSTAKISTERKFPLISFLLLFSLTAVLSGPDPVGTVLAFDEGLIHILLTYTMIEAVIWHSTATRFLESGTAFMLFAS